MAIYTITLQQFQQIVIERSVFGAIFCDFCAREPGNIAKVSDFLDLSVFSDLSSF